MKISSRLITGFSILILILIGEIILNQTITYQTNQTYENIETNIEPSINVLEKYKSINIELKLLLNSKINAQKTDIENNNRIKGIIDVELPYLIKEIQKISLVINSDDSLFNSFKIIIKESNQIIKIVKKIDNILYNKFEDSNKELLAENIYKNEIIPLRENIENKINILLYKYHEIFKSYRNELSFSLKLISRIILITGIIGIIVGTIIAYQITNSISNPINKLKNAASEMSRGNLNEQIKITGKDEISELSLAFNSMSSSLKKNFEDQENYIKQIEEVNNKLKQFVHIASHDLQEPLRTISGYIGLINQLYDPLLDDQGKRFLLHINEASLRMELLITNLLEYSRIGSNIKLTKIDFKVLVDNVILDLNNLITKSNAQINIGSLPTIIGYEIELAQLMRSFISNSIKFQKKDINPEITITCKEMDNEWIFSVKDNGIGIKQEYFDKIFEIFQRINNRHDYNGTGIGLSICKKVVDLHNGKLWVESELNKGTTFFFTIPKALLNEKI